ARQFKIKAEGRSTAGVTYGLRQVVHPALAKPFGKILERRISVNRAMTRRDWSCFRETSEIERTTCFRTGTGQAATAKWLYSDKRTDDIAVDIDVTDADTIGDIGDGFIKTRMQTEGQAVTRRVDIIDQAFHVIALVAHDM